MDDEYNTDLWSNDTPYGSINDGDPYETLKWLQDTPYSSVNDIQRTFDGKFVDQEADLPLAVDPSGKSSWDTQFTGLGKALNSLGIKVEGNDFLNALGSIFSSKLGGFLGTAGIAALLNKQFGKTDPVSTGYQGGIPDYKAVRTQTPMSQQRPAGYRPGQGGISYFTPVDYQKTVPPTSGGVPTKPAQDISIMPVGDNVSLVPSKEQMAAMSRLPAPPSSEDERRRLMEIASQYTFANGGSAQSGIAMLARGGTSNRFLRGKGDGVSDSIPARFTATGKPAALADGEFVIDARTVSEIGNGSSEAGARKLYAMMDQVHAARKRAARGKPSGADRALANLA